MIVHYLTPIFRLVQVREAVLVRFFIFKTNVNLGKILGQKFAMLEIKSVLSQVLRNFQLLPASPPCTFELASEISLQSINGINITLKYREK